MHEALAAEAAALETRARDLMARLDALEKEGSALARELTGVNHSRQTVARLLATPPEPVPPEPEEAPHE